jgi:hypothetical protein
VEAAVARPHPGLSGLLDARASSEWCAELYPLLTAARDALGELAEALERLQLAQKARPISTPRATAARPAVTLPIT